MKAFTLKSTPNYVSHQLIVTGNSFGDQIIHVQFENIEGVKSYLWTELNHEGNHRQITMEFIEYMADQVSHNLIK